MKIGHCTRERRPWPILLAGLLLAGCQTGHVPNPNDPNDVGALSPDTLRRNLGAVTDSLVARRASGELTTQQYRTLVAKAARELVQSVDTTSVKPDQAWEYAEVLRDAQQWKQAAAVLEVAVKYAKSTHDEDRRINDTLRLALVQANLGNIPQALATARSTFDARPKDSVPILISILLELTPAVRGKGHDLEVAKLLEDAISIHMHAEVNPNSAPGRDFLLARPYHIYHAWSLVVELDEAAGRPDLAAKARQKRAATGSSFAQNRIGA